MSTQHPHHHHRYSPVDSPPTTTEGPEGVFPTAPVAEGTYEPALQGSFGAYRPVPSKEREGRGKMDAEEREAVRKSYRTLATGTEKVYMGIAAFEALVVFGIAWASFGLVEANIHNQAQAVRDVLVYTIVFILAQIFSVLFIFDALRARNIVQLCLHLFFNLCITVYAILQIPQTHNAMSKEPSNGCGHFENCVGPNSLFNLLRKLFIVPPIVFGLATIAFCALIRRLHMQFGWAVFHLVGASPMMKRMHRDYQTLISLLKLLLFFAMAFCIAYLILDSRGIQRNTVEFVLTIVALPIVPVCMLACGWALRHENKPIMGFNLGLMVLGLAYFMRVSPAWLASELKSSYKLASMFLPRTAWLYTNTKITLSIFSIFAIIILVTTFAYGCICMSNFGKGLIETHLNPENRTSLWGLPEQVKFAEKMKAQQELGQRPVTNQLVID